MRAIALIGYALHQGFIDCMEMDMDELEFMSAQAQRALETEA